MQEGQMDQTCKAVPASRCMHAFMHLVRDTDFDVPQRLPLRGDQVRFTMRVLLFVASLP